MRSEQKKKSFLPLLIIFLVGLVLIIIKAGSQGTTPVASLLSGTQIPRSTTSALPTIAPTKATIGALQSGPTPDARSSPGQYLRKVTNPDPTETAASTVAVRQTKKATPKPSATPTPTPLIRRTPSDSHAYVWIPKSGKKYHSNSSCSNMSNPCKVTLDTAKGKGLTPCKKCNPPK